MRHMEALWERLHGRFDDANLVVHAWPEAPRRLRSADSASVASWVTLIFGKGVKEGSATASLVDALGTPHPFHLRYTRWGGTSRLVRFQARTDYDFDRSYTAILEPGAELVDGTLTTHAHAHEFRVVCDPNDPVAGAAGDCEPVVVTDDPIIAIAEPTATRTPTSTATASAGPTDTPLPSATATTVPTATATPLSTATAPTAPTDTHTPPATATVAPSSTPTSQRAATPSHTPPTSRRRGSGSCAVAGGAGSGAPLLGMLLVGLAATHLRRRRSAIGRAACVESTVHT
jgi:MYXO-CTERM domain-containing protein